MYPKSAWKEMIDTGKQSLATMATFREIFPDSVVVTEKKGNFKILVSWGILLAQTLAPLGG